MKNIIFIEGVSGVGKSTMVRKLVEKLCKSKIYIEGDPYSPLDLCWAAYLTIPMYEDLLISYPLYAKEMSRNIIYKGEYILLRYQIERTPLYSEELHNELHKREFCYNTTNKMPLEKFTEVFANLWKRFDDTQYDYAIFDATLVSHMTNDLVRNYNASVDELVNHMETLLQIIKPFNPVIFYLSSENVRERVIKARINRGQTPLTDKQIEFWEKRKKIDTAVLPKLSVKVQIIDITNEDWDNALSQILTSGVI